MNFLLKTVDSLIFYFFTETCDPKIIKQENEKEGPKKTICILFIYKSGCENLFCYIYAQWLCQIMIVQKEMLKYYEALLNTSTMFILEQEYRDLKF